MDLDINQYLTRINFRKNPQPDWETLKDLHRLHLLSVPFENLDIHLKREIHLNIPKLWEKIVGQKRGGICYELNGLFFYLLRQLGFEARMISARVVKENGRIGNEFDHMAIIVNLREPWLVDVGFGNNFLEPLRLMPEIIQPDSLGFYQISPYDEQYFVLRQSEDGLHFADKYLFTTISRQLSDYTAMCRFQQTSPESRFTRKRICSIVTETGRVTFSDLNLLITDNGRKTERMLSGEAEFREMLKQYTGIDLL